MSTWQTRRTAVTRTALRVTLSALLMCVSLALPAPAHAQLKRIDVVENYSGWLYHRWSYDGGTHWSNWVQIPAHTCGGSSPYHQFKGTPSMVSDRMGRLWLAGRTTTGKILISSFTWGNGTWSGWCGTGTVYDGGVTLSRIGLFNFEITPYTWDPNALPAITSWGPGRLDLFINARRGDGVRALLHAWRTSDGGEFKWESLGTGLMHGSPAAVSWGPGRIDVFSRIGDRDLAKKTFANGQWYPWQSLDIEVSSTPTVISTGPEQLSLYVRGFDSALYHRWHGAIWFGWEYLGGGNNIYHHPPAVVARDEWTLDVYALMVGDANGPGLYKKTFFFGWSDYQYQYHTASIANGISAYSWRVL